jgi:hypothetical protein
VYVDVGSFCDQGHIDCTEVQCPPHCCCGAAHYRLTLHGKFTRDMHPYQYPKNAHFSPLIGAVHSFNYTLWSEFGLASPGVQSVCEKGLPSTLVSTFGSWQACVYS